jgi:hypothetical protein
LGIFDFWLKTPPNCKSCSKNGQNHQFAVLSFTFHKKNPLFDVDLFPRTFDMESHRCPGRQARSMSCFRTSWGAFSRSCSEVSVWCQTSTRVHIESNFYNTCPTDMKLNQSG